MPDLWRSSVDAVVELETRIIEERRAGGEETGRGSRGGRFARSTMASASSPPAPAVRVNTGTGCHLEADMVALGLAELKPAPPSVVMIKNVANLVCPVMFDQGISGLGP